MKPYILQMSDAEIWLWGAGLAFSLMFVCTLAAWAFDRRLIGRDRLWAKPLKFEISLAIHFFTLALLAGYLSAPLRHGAVLNGTVIAAVAAAGFEIVYILWRAARQEGSHFNLKTPFAGLMYGLMAVGAVILTVAAGVVGVLIGLDGGFSGGSGLKTGAIIGLIGGTVLTLITAFVIGGALSHHVGVEAPDAPRMPLTGWSRTVGDRRPAHFLATHMMQVLPFAGWLCDLAFTAPASWLMVLGLTLAYLRLTLWVFQRGNRGLPLF